MAVFSSPRLFEFNFLIDINIYIYKHIYIYIHIIYPLVNVYIAIEHGPVEIVDLPINSMVDLSIVFCMFTKGYYVYPLVNVYITMENHHAINGKTHYFNGPFSIANC